MDLRFPSFFVFECDCGVVWLQMFFYYGGGFALAVCFAGQGRVYVFYVYWVIGRRMGVVVVGSFLPSLPV